MSEFLEYYKANMAKLREEEVRKKDMEKVNKELKDFRRNFQRLDIPLDKDEEGNETNTGSKIVRSLLNVFMTPLILYHSVVEKTPQGNRYSKELCSGSYGVPCAKCEYRRKNYKNLTDAERTNTYLAKAKILFLYDPFEAYREIEYNRDGETFSFRPTPIRYFARSSGEAESNFFELANYEKKCKVPMDEFDLDITKLVGANGVTYKIAYSPENKGKFEPPTDLYETHQLLLDQILKAKEEGDIITLFDMAAKTFDLPRELKEYPNQKDNVFFKNQDEEFSSTSLE